MFLGGILCDDSKIRKEQEVWQYGGLYYAESKNTFVF